jgi:hypothetical protein
MDALLNLIQMEIKIRSGAEYRLKKEKKIGPIVARNLI